MHFPVFRVLYSTTFTILLLVLLGLLLITPADGIYQSILNDQLWNVVVIAGVYVFTLFLAGFVYATRIYTTRTHLATIPKAYIPIRKSDLSHSVRRLIVEGLARSASIAYNAHPRDLRQEKEKPEALAPDVQGDSHVGMEAAAPPAHAPTWGTIAHPGWSSPSALDLPNVHFEPVIIELPHLVEAKAVSLAPPDPLSVTTPTSDNPHHSQSGSLPDPVAVALLQRPAVLSFRDYLSHLSSLAMFDDPAIPASFLAQYERARFSTVPMSESAFRRVMADFSALLGSMCSPDPVILAAAAEEFAASSVSASPPTTGTSSSTTPTTNRSRCISRASSALRQLDLDGDIPSQQTPGPQPLKPLPQPISTSAGSASSSKGPPSAATPFLTPYLNPYPASISSNDGDHEHEDEEEDEEEEEEEDDTGSEYTAYTAWTRPMQRSSSGLAQLRSNSYYSSGSRTTRVSKGRGLDGDGDRGVADRSNISSDHSGGTSKSRSRQRMRPRTRRSATGASGSAADASEDDGSVIRRAVTSSPTRSDASGGSVVRRAELVAETLPLPVAVDDGGGRRSGGHGLAIRPADGSATR